MYQPSSSATDAAITSISASLQELEVADRLVALRSLACLIGSARASAVLGARAGGMSWQDIGNRLGMSRQAVWERYGDEDIAAPAPCRGRPPRPRAGLHPFSSCASYKAVTTRPQ
jgi:hypothetical protein